MEQHPVPQHVSSYQFKLVGDMTLKQFFQLAGGFLISLLFYASHLHPLIKWPVMIFFALLGVALAFLPFEDRPLEKWIISFFKAIYSPTIYSWEKSPPVSYFQSEGESAPPHQEKVIAPGGEKALTNYLSETPDKRLSFFSKLEGAEKAFLSKTLDLFGAGELRVGKSPVPQETVPLFYQGVTAQAPIRPVAPVATPIAAKTELYQVAPTQGEAPVAGGQAAQFSAQAAPPNPPTLPNLITGQVMDDAGKIVEAAIMEIRDSEGRPVRALKTNKLGHFMIVTPLANGKYEIITEKEGFEFAPVTFETAGEIIPPIAIRAKSVSQPVNAQQSIQQSNIQSTMS